MVWQNKTRLGKILAGVSLAAALCWTGAPDYVQAAPVQVSEENATQAEAYFSRGQEYFQRNYLVKALEAYDQSIRLDPTKAEVFAARANLYVIMGNAEHRQGIDEVLQALALADYEQAARDYTEALALEPNNANYLLGRGVVYTGLDRFDEALADFSAAIRLKPNNYGIYDQRALAYIDKGDYAKAEQDLDTALKINPKDGLNGYYRGIVFARQGKYDAAIKKFDEAIKENPWFAEAWLQEGQVFEVMGRPLDALYAYREFMKRDNEHNPYTHAFVNERMQNIKLR